MFWKSCIGKKDAKTAEVDKLLNNFFTYTVVEEPNLGSKKSMEDFTISELDVTGNGRFALFCILDGHGGHEVASFAKVHYPKILARSLKEITGPTFEGALTQSVHNLTKALMESIKSNSGSTFCAIFIDRTSREYYTINLGDSRAYKASKNKLSTGLYDWEFKLLTVDHKLSNEAERERIRKVDGILNNRVGGQVLVTRAIGDFSFHQYGLSAEPDIARYKLDKESYLLAGSDGVWDFIEEREIFQLLADPTVTGSSTLAKGIMEIATRRSVDNLSIIVIAIKS